jgi:hypothetical protein
MMFKALLGTFLLRNQFMLLSEDLNLFLIGKTTLMLFIQSTRPFQIVKTVMFMLASILPHLLSQLTRLLRLQG